MLQSLCTVRDWRNANGHSVRSAHLLAEGMEGRLTSRVFFGEQVGSACVRWEWHPASGEEFCDLGDVHGRQSPENIGEIGLGVDGATAALSLSGMEPGLLTGMEPPERAAFWVKRCGHAWRRGRMSVWRRKRKPLPHLDNPKAFR